jgi:D-alanyl-D-alanine carboxypeptidase
MTSEHTALDDWCRRVGAIGASAGVRSPGGADRYIAVGRNGGDAMPTSGRFRIASVTKTFTSALALRCVERGTLALDATLDSWFPQFPNAAKVTIRMLLEHTSGTADIVFDDFDEYRNLLLSDLGRVYAPGDVVAVAAARPPFAEPGTYRYSNTDYVLLGAVAEEITGASFAELVASEFADPLGLTATAYEIGDDDLLLHGWFDLNSDGSFDPCRVRALDTRDLPGAALLSFAFAAGGMTSSLADLLEWGEALYLGSVLSPSMRETLLASPRLIDPDGHAHGFGVFRYTHADRTFYGHTGNIIGSSVFVGGFPDSGHTIAVHANVLEVPSSEFVELAAELVAHDG